MALTRAMKIRSLSSNRFPFYLWVKAVPVLCHPEKHVFNIVRVAGTWLERGGDRWHGWVGSWVDKGKP